MNVTLFLLISFLLLVGKISAQDDHETSLGCLKNYCPPNVLSDWKEALQELYDKTGGDNWMVNNGWKEVSRRTRRIMSLQYLVVAPTLTLPFPLPVLPSPKIPSSLMPPTPPTLISPPSMESPQPKMALSPST